MSALAGGSCKEGSRGGGWICGRFDPRSEILIFFNAGFSLLAVWKSGLFFCSFSSWLRFGWQKRAVLHFASTSDSTNPLFMCMVSMSYNDTMWRTSW
jgi:hypothetical protein